MIKSNLKMVVLAVAGACSMVGVAHAESNVTVYGKMDASVEATSVSNTSGSGSDLNSFSTSTNAHQVSRNRVTSNDSYIGFKGVEDLGNGLKAKFQLEASVAFDGGAAKSSGNDGSASLFSNRESFIGLEGAWGDVKVGHMATPYHVASIAVDPFYGRTASIHSVIGSPGFGVGVAGLTGAANTISDASFNTRQGNSISYSTPVYQGFSGTVAYASNEGRATEGANPQVWSVSVNKDFGNGLTVGYAYETKRDYFGLAQLQGGAVVNNKGTASNDQGHKLVAGYDLGNGVKIGGVVEQLRYHSDTSYADGMSDYKRLAYGVTGSYTLGANVFKAAVVHANAGSCSAAQGGDCSTAGLSTTAYSLGVSHNLSKRTEVYAQYSFINNGDAASYTSGFNGVTTANGGNLQTLGAGMAIKF